MTSTLFALVMTVFLTSGEVQDQVIGVYDSVAECQLAAVEQKVNGDCFPVEKIYRPGVGEIPAGI